MRLFKKRWVKILFQLTGIALFAVILTRIDLHKVIGAFRNFSGYYILYALGIMFLFTLVKSLRWRAIVALQGMNVSKGRSFRIYASALYLGVVTPGRVGDFAKSLYLINKGLSTGKALFSSLLDRLFDIIFLVVIGYVSLLFFPGIFKNQLLLSSLLFAVVIVLAGTIFFRRDILHRLARKFIGGTVPSRFKDGLQTITSDTLDELGHLDARRSIMISLLTFAAWVLHYSFFIMASRALGMDIPIAVLAGSISASIFVSLLPISLLGLGTRDMVLILIFSRYGLSREAAVSFSFTFVLVYLIMGVIGLISWLTAPFDLKRSAGSKGNEEK